MYSFKNHSWILLYLICLVVITTAAIILFDVAFPQTKAKTFETEKKQYHSVIESALELYETPEACLGSLQIAYDSMFAEAGSYRTPPPSLGEVLKGYYTAAIQHKSPEVDPYEIARIDKVLAVVQLQRNEEPYTGLPDSDLAFLVDIKDKLSGADPELTRPLLGRLAAVLLEKNGEAKRYQDEASRANQVTLISLVVAVMALIPALIGFLKWASGLSLNKPGAPPASAVPAGPEPREKKTLMQLMEDDDFAP